MTTVRLSVELCGGLELLFGRQKRLEIDVPADAPAAEAGGGDGAPPPPEATMRGVVAWLRDHRLRERPDLFVAGDSVRPGILVLVNDADWALEGGLEARVRDGDALVFISTLHGG